ncbi:unnamed protein product, partial [Meganyctiphanes norvegica]
TYDLSTHISEEEINQISPSAVEDDFANMVVTSRMLAAHTNGYPIDVSSRFWSTYYKSLKDIHVDDSRPRASVAMRSAGNNYVPHDNHGSAAPSHNYTYPTYPKTTYPLILNPISPLPHN